MLGLYAVLAGSVQLSAVPLFETVTVHPVDAAQVLKLALANGANQSGAIDWRLTDRKMLQAKAAANALIKARVVAAQMADGLHVKLGDLVYASNQAPNTNIYFPLARKGVTLNTATAEVSTTVMQAPPLEIRPQTIREEATVYAVFAVE